MDETSSIVQYQQLHILVAYVYNQSTVDKEVAFNLFISSSLHICNTTKRAETKRLKGVKKSKIKRDIQFKDYKNCIMNQITYKASMNTFKSHHHQVQSITINKTSLSSFDDKRYLCPDGLSTLPYGHYSIQ